MIRFQSGFWKFFSFLAILVILLLIFKNYGNNKFENPTPAPPESQPDGKTPPSSKNSKYLGVSQQAIMESLEKNENASGNRKPKIFKEDKTEQGEPSTFIGFADDNTMINLLGAKDDLSSVSMLMNIENDTKLIDDQISREDALMEATLPEWTDHQEWFNKSVKKLLKEDTEILEDKENEMVYMSRDGDKLFLAIMSKKWINEQ